MPKPNLARLGALAVVTLGLLLPMAGPAPAIPQVVTINASSTITLGAVVTHFGGHPTTQTCAPNSTTASISPDFDSTGGITMSSANYNFPWVDFTLAGNSVKMRYIPTSVQTAGSSSFFGNPSVPRVQLSLTGTYEFRTCDSTTVICRTNPVTYTLTDPAYTGSHPHPAPSDTATIAGPSAANVITQIGCNALIRAAIHNLPSAMSLNLHF